MLPAFVFSKVALLVVDSLQTQFIVTFSTCFLQKTWRFVCGKYPKNPIYGMKRRILLVEDEPTIQRLLHFVLSRDFDIQSTANGYEAFLWLEQREIPDLIIMDWMMPQMDGGTFLKYLKVSGLYCEIPVIVLSASEAVRRELSDFPHPVNHCLHKPFDPLKLKDTIGNIFNTSTYGFAN